MIFDEENYKASDKELWEAVYTEEVRQQDNIELITSEDAVSKVVMATQGALLTNKYAEGYPGKRYYGGTDRADIVKNLAIGCAKELFGAKFANVQPHPGGRASAAAYMVLIQPGNIVPGMDLTAGGHLTHGVPVSFSGETYRFISCTADPMTECIDYDKSVELVEEAKLKLIIVGVSAYSCIIDLQRSRAIADSVGAYLMVDMAYIAGLAASGYHPSPVPYTHITTTTAHEILRGPRGGLILTNDEALAEKINSATSPGLQGGPLMRIIAGKAVVFKEALDPAFKEYDENVIKNAAAMAGVFKQHPNFHMISGGTDNHIFLIDMVKAVESGKVAQNAPESVDIMPSKSSVPFENLSPFETPGIRIGSPATMNRGIGEKESRATAELIVKALENYQSETILEEVYREVKALTDAFPLY